MPRNEYQPGCGQGVLEILNVLKTIIFKRNNRNIIVVITDGIRQTDGRLLERVNRPVVQVRVSGVHYIGQHGDNRGVHDSYAQAQTEMRADESRHRRGGRYLFGNIYRN